MKSTKTFRTMLLVTLVTALAWAIPALAQPAVPTITTAPSASNIGCGQTLADSVLSGGVAEVDSVAVAGTFTWTDNTIYPDFGTSSQSVTFTPDDLVNYTTVDGTADVTVADVLGPEIFLNGPNPDSVECGGTWTDQGAWATDACEGDAGVDASGTVNTAVPGVYTIVYTSCDSLSNCSNVSLLVTVTNNATPVISLTGSAALTVECGATYSDAGATASDSCVGSITVTTGGSVNTASTGVYTLTYNATNGTNAAAEVTRVVTVSDTAAPVITLVGSAAVTTECNGTYTDAGATASDACAGSLTASITTGGSVNTAALGTYTLTYNVSDGTHAAAEVTRVVTVSDTTKPVITLTGSAAVTVECNGTYTDGGASASDSCAGSVTVTSGGSVNTAAVGAYTLTYNATDGTNAANEVTRVVTVSDTVKPVVTLAGSAAVTVECGGAYTDDGATAADSCAGSLSVSTGGSVNTAAVGVYTLTFDATDGTNAADQVTRVVTVSDTTKPVISLTGSAALTVECGATYTDAGATASDVCAGSPTVTKGGSVNAAAVGVYTLTYNATDGHNAADEVTRVVTVSDTAKPVITLTGSAAVTTECGGTYTDAGATASDACAGSLTVTKAGSVDTAVLGGVYTLTYNVSDGTNAADEVTRVVTVADTTAPVITLTGSAAVTVECTGTYTDAGATAADACAGSLTASISTSDPVNTAAVGVYTVTYNVSDGNGHNAAEVTRVVTVSDTVKPVITLTGDAAVTVECHGTYTDAGATASDTCAGALTASISTSDPVNVNAVGVYTITYNVSDGHNAADQVSRVVTVSDTIKPVITLTGSSAVTVECHGTYSDAGATASDVCAGSLTVTEGGSVNVNAVGVYTLTYNVSDGHNAADQVTRVVTVEDTTKPTITLTGSAAVTVECAGTYTDAGATATDACAGSLTASIAKTGSVNTAVLGTYTLAYNVSDGHGNNADEVTRVVTVSDTTVPVITRNGSAAVTVECGGSYTDAGATATDACAGSLTASITTVDPVNTAAVGVYTVTYNVSDGNGHSAAEVSRVVTVSDTVKPVITLTGSSAVTVECGGTYTEAGATATDACAGSPSVTIAGSVNTAVLGAYTLTYNATDGHNAATQVTRVVTVSDTTNPVVTISGSNPVTFSCGTVSLPGATASDVCAGSLSASVYTLGGLNLVKPSTGTYNVVYKSAPDASSRTGSSTLVVVVTDASDPTITCPAAKRARSDASGYALVPDFTAEATTSDDCGGTLTVTQSPAAGTSKYLGTYTVTLTVTDANGKSASCDTSFTVGVRGFLVDPTSTGTQTGASWTTAFHTLQAAVDAAAAAGGGEVWVAGGSIGSPVVYGEDRTEAWGSPASVAGSLVMKDGVSLYGGFEGYRSGAGKQESFLSQRNRYLNVTVIDGTTARGGNKAYHVIVFGKASGATSSAVVDGFDITGGNASGVTDDYHTFRGGAIYNWRSAPTISNCRFYNNTAKVSGGAVANESLASIPAGPNPAVPTVTGNASATYLNCLFYKNTATRDVDTAVRAVRGGGAVFNDMATATFTGCTFANNSLGTPAYTTFGQNSAGMLNWHASPVIKSSIIKLNNTGDLQDNRLAASTTASVITYTDAAYTYQGAPAATGGWTNTNNATPSGTGDINSDPLFTSLATDDYSLTATSPAKDTADPTFSGTDLDGVPRPTNGGTALRSDMGALERSNAPSVSCLTPTVDLGVATTITDPALVYDPALSVVQAGIKSMSLSANSFSCSDIPVKTGAVTLTVTDILGRTGTCLATVNVTEHTNPTAVANPITVHLNSSGGYVLTLADIEAIGAGSTDNCSVSWGTSAVEPHVFDCSQVGSAVNVTLTVKDTAGNSATANTTVTVADSIAPVIHLTGSAAVTVECGASYSDAGATATDNCASSFTITTVNPVNTAAVGVYTVTYDTTDGHGNSAAEVTRVVTVSDTTKPVITLTGSAALSVECASTYVDAGATASDVCAGNLTASISVSDPVNTAALGVYTVTYNVVDGHGNTANTVSRVVTVHDTTKPVITLTGSAAVTVECHSTYTDDGATASDACAGSLTASITKVNPVNANTVGVYTVTYNVSDGHNAADQVTRVVTVSDTTKPVITLTGSAAVNAECGGTYTDAGATASDTCGGSLTASITTSNAVSTAVLGSVYTITYNVTDAHSNVADEVTRVVTVTDTEKPVITLSGSAAVTVECGGTYTDGGSTASDQCAGGLTDSIVTYDPVDAAITGVYTVTYDVNDGNGHDADQVTRVVTVSDTTAPVISLVGSAAVTVECGGTYTELEATAYDACEGDIGVDVNNSAVNTAAVGVYTVVYTSVDSVSNSSQATRLVTVSDTTKPVISLTGSAAVTLECGGTYSDAGATASDVCAGSLTASIVTVDPVNTAADGVYTITYNVSDGYNAADQVTRVVTVEDTTKPVISLVGSAAVNTECGGTYVDAGATASDICAGNLTASIVKTGSVNTSVLGGVYTIAYNVSDGTNAADEVTRVVTVVDTEKPVISLSGSAAVTVECGATYTDGGATATDQCAGSLTASIVTVDPVTPAAVGVYTVTYNVSDGNGHDADQVTRIVTVSDTTAPVISLTGSAEVTVECSGTYTEAGATATDACAGTPTVTIGGSVDTAVKGSYTLTYNATDGVNAAAEVTRVVTVSDTIAPVISLNGSAAVTVECSGTFTDDGASATDACAGTPTVTVAGSVNAAAVGVYTLTYNATDGVNAAAEVTRVVTVSDTIAPVISLNGSAAVAVECGSTYTDGGATASDACAGSPTVTVGGSVNTATPGVYTLTYNATDGHNAAAEVTRVVTVSDTEAPIITLTGSAAVTVECGSTYTDGGATASDACTGSVEVTTGGSVNTAVSGVYTLTYNATNGVHAAAEVTRVVTVSDTTAPVISLVGSAAVTVECSGTYTDGGATASDACAGSPTVTTGGSVNTALVGVYTLTYNATDGVNAAAEATRVVTVSDTTAPVISLNGSAAVTVECTGTYTDGGASASDSCVGSVEVTTGGSVNTAVTGSYTLTYNATDGANAAVEVTRVVTVSDTIAPVISLNGSAALTVECGSTYSDGGASATDACAGSVEVTTGGSVNTATPGVYTLTYNATDGVNAAAEVTRVVTVGDTVAPIISLNGSAAVTAECGSTYTDDGATASDACTGSVEVTTTGSVNTAVAGAYTLAYNATNGVHPAIEVTRVVTVSDTIAPVISLVGSAAVTVECSGTYTDGGATASDACAGSPTVTTGGSVNTALVGVYTLTYNATDGVNAAAEVTRVVTVSDTTAPVISLVGSAAVTVECGGTYSDGGATASDSCLGSVEVTAGGSVNAAATGSYTLTYNATDGVNAAAEVTRVVTVSDTTAPVISLVGSAAVTVECSGTYTDGGATASDACAGSPTVTTGGSVNTATPGAYTLTYNATDGVNAAAEVTRVVTVSDTVAPVISLVGSAAVTAECGSTYTDGGATATDACAGSPTVTTGGSVNTAVAGAYTLTYNATDGVNAAAEVTRVVTVSDTIAPVISLVGSAALTVECGATYTDGGATASDACAGSPTVTTGGSVDTALTGVYTLTYNATDGVNAAAEVTRVVTVSDTTAPVISLNGSAAVAVECGATYTDGGATATDVCAGSVTVTTGGSVNAAAPGAYTLTYNATDGVNAALEVTRVVTVSDTFAPEISLNGSAAVTVECGASYSDGGATAIDACAGGVEVTTGGSVNTAVAGAYTLTYNATDGTNASAEVTRVVTVSDTIAPVISLVGSAALTVECGGTYTDGGATATDACAGAPEVTAGGSVNTAVAGAYTLTYNATDGVNAAAEVTRVVTVSDTIAPVISLVGSAALTVECGGTYADGGATAADACAGSPTVTTGGSVDTAITGVYTLTYNATDGVNAAAEVTRVVTVSDTTAPVISLNGSAAVAVECGATYSDGGATATDACAGSPTVTTGGSVNAAEVGVYTLTYNATDGVNAAAEVTRVVTVSDTTAPVISLNGSAAVTVECGATYSDGGATATDACSGGVGVTVGGSVNTAVTGAYTLTYNATDGVNAAAEVTRVVTVSDTTAPVISLTGSAAVTVECSGTYTDDGATASDVCVGSVSVTTGGSVNTAVVGVYTLTYNASDGLNAAAEVTRVVTVSDTVKPVITLTGSAALTVECGATYSDAGATAADNCAGSVSVTTGGSVNTAAVGAYTLTYDATDGHNAADQVTRVVTVSDTVKPVISLTGSAAVTVACAGTYSDAGATASDTCAGSVSVTKTGTVNTAAVGVYTLAYNATDGHNAADEVTRVVTVSDTVKPVITLTGSAALTVECAGTYTDAGATASDACAGSLTVTTGGSVNTAAVGAYTLTYNVSDGHNAADEVTRVVTVSDTVKPVITLLGSTPVSVLYGATYTDAGATATDACAGALTVTTGGSVNTSAVGAYTLTYNVSDGHGNSANQVTRVVNVAGQPPAVTVNQAVSQIDPTLAPSVTYPMQFTVVFSEAVSGFAVGDVTWSGGTITPTTYTITGSGASYSINVTALSGTGTVKPTLAANVATSVATGVGNAASTSTDNTVTVTTGAASLTVSAPATNNFWANGSTHTISWTSSLVPGTTDVAFWLYTYPAGTYVVLPISGVKAYQGSTTWTVPNAQAAGNYRIRVVANTTSNFGPVSPNYFQIGAPKLTLNGSTPVTVACGTSYTDAGATASDGYTPALTVTTGGTVNTAAVGTYTLTYDTNDGHGNSAAQITRVVNVTDTTAPVITLAGSAAVTIECGSTYTDGGATASDACAGSPTVTTGGSVNAAAVGVYTLTYNATDGHNAAAQVTRVVTVSDTTKPVLSLNGSAALTVECGSTYTDGGATASDACAGSLTVTTGGSVNPAAVGVYTLTYNVSDGHNAADQITRVVTVSDTIKPVITLLGSASVDVERNTSYTDAGATASDACAGDLTASIAVTNPVNIAATGTYTVRYNVGDGHNAANEVTRIVNVFFIDHAPVITHCPSARSLQTDAICEATVPNLVSEVTATDDVTAAGSLVITQSPAAGTVISGAGVHMVTISVKDEVLNETTCSVALTLAAFDYAHSVETVVPWAVNNGGGGAIYAVASTATTLFVGGNFTGAGPAASVPSSGWKNLAKIDIATGTVDATWQPVVESGTYPVRALALSADGSILYVANGGMVDAVNVATKAVTRLTSQSQYVYALAVSQGYLYFGGANMGSSHYMGVITLSSGAFYGWMTNVTSTVTAAAVAGDSLYVGLPTSIGTLSLTTGALTTFSATNGAVKGLAASCGAVYAAGAFTTLGGLSRSGLGVLDAAATVQTSWVPVLASAGTGYALCVTDTALYGTGSFTTIDGYAFPGTVRFANTSAPTVTVEQASGQIDPAPAPTVGVPIQFTVTFSEAVTGFAGTTNKLTWGGTATGVTYSITGTGTTYTVNVTASTAGTLIPSLGAGKVYGAGGNYNAASTSTDNSVTVSAGTGTLTVTAPTAGTYWGAGTTKAITWTAPLVTGNVTISLYDYTPAPGDAGAHPVTLASGIPASQGSWSWAIPADQAYGTYYRVRVVSSSLSAYSGTYLEIGPNDVVAPTVTVNQAAGQIDPAPTPNSSYPVQFSVQFSEPVVGFTIDDVSWAGSTATGITANVLAGTGGAYTIRVTSCGTGTLIASIPAGGAQDLAHNVNTASTSTDNTVTVAGPAPTTFAVTAPATNDYWAAGTTHAITWDGSLLAGNATIQLWDYNGTALTNVNYGTYVELTSTVAANAGTWSWTVPSGQTAGANYKLRVLATQTQNAPATYTGYFEIGPDTPFLRVTSSNTGTPVYAPGTTLAVNWMSYRVTGNVSVYLYDYTGASATNTLLASNIPASNGGYSWAIPAGQTLGGMYKIRVYQSASIGDFNDVYFAIGTGTPTVLMTSPNGAETWTRGTTQTITFTTNAIADTLIVQLWNYTTGASETLAAAAKPARDGNNTLSYTIPAGHVTGTKFKVRAVTRNGAISDFSNNYFTIN